MKTLTISQDQFEKGLHIREDDSKAPLGSAQLMQNVIISDRGGITTRPGTALIGAYNSTASVIRGLYNFKKSNGQDDILVKTYDDEVEYLHPEQQVWSRLKNGFTTDQEFGFTYSLVNTDNEDFMYFCNRFEEYQRWRGAYTQLNGALAGGETSVTVDSVLADPIYYSSTATANSATTVTVSTATYATDMWKNFYIYFPGTGKVRLISGNNGTVITFATLGAGPGNVAFQIRKLKFPASGTIIYAGTTIAYTTIDIATVFPVASAHAAADNTPVTIVPEVFVGAPRGNRMDTLKGRVYVGRVRSAISRDSGGGLQGSTQAGSEFVSKLLDPSNFEFSATRTAGEGDIINVPYGGGDITDTKAFEDEMAIYKRDYIELVKYTEDVNDTAIRTPLKTGVGSVGKVIKGTDDHFFMTPDNKYTSLGRVRLKDVTPQSENLGYVIKRLLDEYNNDEFSGIEFNNRILSTHKQDGDANKNNIILVYNKKTKSFEGIWSVGANALETYKSPTAQAAELVYGESNGANIWKMFQSRKSDVRSATEVLPFSSVWKSNFFNLLPIKSNIQAINSIAIEGYIAAGTTFTFKLYKDFENEEIFSFNFGGTEEDFLQGGNNLVRFFASDPFATIPVGSISGVPDETGRRRFSFIVYFPYFYGQYFATSIQSSGKDQDWEIIRMSLGLKESISTRTSNTKVV